MRNLILVAAVIALAHPLFADRSALIEHDDEWNLFSKFELSVSEIDEDSAMFGGLTIGGLLNDHMGIGLAAHVLLNSVDLQSTTLSMIDEREFWYGGGYLEYVFSPDNLVYFSIDVLVGGGTLKAESIFGEDEEISVLVIEPGLNLMINVTETFNVGIGTSYRFVEGVDVDGLDNSAVSGLTGNIYLRFTQF